jgi:hypothetical protein
MGAASELGAPSSPAELIRRLGSEMALALVEADYEAPAEADLRARAVGWLIESEDESLVRGDGLDSLITEALRSALALALAWRDAAPIFWMADQLVELEG